jgi:glutaminase
VEQALIQDIPIEIHRELAPRAREGKVVSHIPELAKVDPRKSGMAVCKLQPE